MESVFKRFIAKDGLVSGAYKNEFGGEEDEIKNVIKRVNEFEKKDGRRPRILGFLYLNQNIY
jgi:methylmalonyl-CoA mutase